MMEALHSILRPYSDILMNIAATVTTLQFLSGIFLLLEIRKNGSSLNIPSGPFLGGIILSLLSLKYGILLRDDGMVKVNFIGLALNIIYICYYYIYTPKDYKTKFWGKIGLTGLISFIALAYTEYEDPELVEYRVGMLLTIILICLVGMPFASLGEIIRKKSTEGLPFPLILSGFIVSTAWMLYGISINNSILTVQNLILSLMSFSQLLLFVIYPSSAETKTKNKKE